MGNRNSSRSFSLFSSSFRSAALSSGVPAIKVTCPSHAEVTGISAQEHSHGKLKTAPPSVTRSPLSSPPGNSRAPRDATEAHTSSFPGGGHNWGSSRESPCPQPLPSRCKPPPGGWCVSSSHGLTARSLLSWRRTPCPCPVTCIRAAGLSGHRTWDSTPCASGTNHSSSLPTPAPTQLGNVTGCFTPQLLISDLDALNLKFIDSNLVRAGSVCLMPAQWVR